MLHYKNYWVSQTIKYKFKMLNKKCFKHNKSYRLTTVRPLLSVLTIFRTSTYHSIVNLLSIICLLFLLYYKMPRFSILKVVSIVENWIKLVFWWCKSNKYSELFKIFRMEKIKEKRLILNQTSFQLFQLYLFLYLAI